jgi:hypothetical protein
MRARAPRHARDELGQKVGEPVVAKKHVLVGAAHERLPKGGQAAAQRGRGVGGLALLGARRLGARARARRHQRRELLPHGREEAGHARRRVAHRAHHRAAAVGGEHGHLRLRQRERGLACGSEGVRGVARSRAARPAAAAAARARAHSDAPPSSASHTLSTTSPTSMSASAGEPKMTSPSAPPSCGKGGGKGPRGWPSARARCGARRAARHGTARTRRTTLMSSIEALTREPGTASLSR